MTMYSAERPQALLFAPDRSTARSIAGAAAYTLLRVGVGIIMAAHGTQKLLDFEAFRGQIDQLGIPVPAIMAPLAMAGELLGGLGLVFGLLTPVAAFGVLATMMVAILSVHLPHGLFAKDGGFEYPLTLACAALCFMINGAGPFSLDAALGYGTWSLARRPLPLLEAAPRTGLPFGVAETRPSGHLPSDGDIDEVTRAGMESFPASDPPAHSSQR